jgi:replicative DNA helicase
MKNKKNIDINFDNFGKVPPQARELEEAVLGALMIEKNAYDLLIDINLKPEYFYIDANQRIYSAIVEMNKKCLVVDLLTVVEELKNKGELDICGGAFYITKLTNKVVSTASIKQHAIIILDKYIQRELIRISNQTTIDVFNNDVDVHKLIDKLNEQSYQLTNILNNLSPVSITDVGMNIINKIRLKSHNAKNGIKNKKEIFTGIREWDNVNGALFPAVYTIAGRPAMGKGIHLTELICRMGKNYKIGVVNGEMTNEQLLVRIGCNLLSIDNELWKKDPLNITDTDIDNVELAMNEAINLKLFLTDEKEISKIVNKIKIWVRKDEVKCVLIDFLNIINVDEEKSKYWNDTQILNYVMGQLADAAKKIEVPIILYVQMNREILKRHGAKEPNMGDLKGSGKIDELSYQISFLHRPEYYDPNETVDEFGESTKGLMYQIIAKHREGVTKKLKLKAIMQCSQLRDWDENIYTDDLLKGMPF